MADVKPGDSVTVEFCTQVFATGVATNADSLPVGTLNRNGTDDGAVTVTVTNLDAGRYKAVFTVPVTYIPGDVLNLTISATVSAVAGKAAIFHTKLGTGYIRSGTAQGGGASTITLDAGASATDSFYQYRLIRLVSGTGAGQCGIITGYVGATKVATVAEAWIVAPDSTTVFVVDFIDADWAKVSDLVSTSVVAAAVVAAMASAPVGSVTGAVGSVTGGATSANQTTLIDLLQADYYIDTTTTPWDFVLIKKGTGDLGVGTELLRQKIKDIIGQNVTSATQTHGSKVT